MTKVAYVNVEHQHIKSKVKNLTISVSMCNELQSLGHLTYVFHVNEDISNLPSYITILQCENEMIIIEEVFKLLRDRDIVIFDLLNYSFEYLMNKYRELGGNFTNLFLDQDLEDDLFEIETLKTRKSTNGMLIPLNIHQYRYKYNFKPIYKMYCFHSIINTSQNELKNENGITSLGVIINNHTFKSILEIEDNKDYSLITSLHMLNLNHSLGLLEKHFRDKLSPYYIYHLVFKEIFKYYINKSKYVRNSEDLEHEVIKQRSYELCKQIYMGVYYKQIELLDKGELIWNVSEFNSYSINNWLTNIVKEYIGE